MIAIGRFPEPFSILYCNASLFHQTACAVPTYILAILPQLLGHPTRTITSTCARMDLSDPGNQKEISINDDPTPISHILVKPAPAYPHHLAQNGDREGPLLLLDKVESHFDRLAKKAVAFFNMSRSISSRLTSLRSRCSSSFSGVMHPLPGKACMPSFSICPFQRLKTLESIPRLRAAPESLYPCSVTSLTASTLNSFVNPLRF